VFLAVGQAEHARAEHAAALALADKIGHTYRQAHAHDGLGRAYRAADRCTEARCHWQQALTLYTELGAPEANQSRVQLTMTSDHGLPER